MPCGAGTSPFGDPSLSSLQVISITLVTEPRVGHSVPGAASQGRAGLPALPAPCALPVHRHCSAVLVLAVSTGYKRMSSNDLCPDIHVFPSAKQEIRTIV